MAVSAFVTVLAVVVAAVGGAVVGAAAVRWKVRDDRATAGRSGPTVAELLARLVRKSQAGIAVVNRFGDVVLANERAEKLGAVTDSRPDPRIGAALERVVVTGEPVEVDLSPPSHPPGRVPQSVIAQVRPLGDGFVVVDATDTSDAVRLEAVRRDFVANVGHELKTPVGAMAVLAEAVLDADDPDEVEHFATKILHESRRLGSLVTELIELSRLQGAERLPELARVDVDDVLEAALHRVRVAAETVEATITPDAPSGLEVAGDRTLLVTALANLLENAIAYSPDGAPVSVRRRAVDDHVEISVTDRGIGIAPEHQQRVFERFFRVDPARSRATGGTGLGLAIVKHVAANHGGDVRLWSEPGVGSTFTLRVPSPSGGPAPSPSSSGSPAASGSSGSPRSSGSSGSVPSATLSTAADARSSPSPEVAPVAPVSAASSPARHDPARPGPAGPGTSPENRPAEPVPGRPGGAR